MPSNKCGEGYREKKTTLGPILAPQAGFVAFHVLLSVRECLSDPGAS